MVLAVANRVFSIHIRPIHPSGRDGCSFFPAADGFNPEGFAFVHVSLRTNGKNLLIPTSVRLRAVLPTSLFKELLHGCWSEDPINYETAQGEAISVHLMT